MGAKWGHKNVGTEYDDLTFKAAMLQYRKLFSSYLLVFPCNSFHNTILLRRQIKKGPLFCVLRNKIKSLGTELIEHRRGVIHDYTPDLGRSTMYPIFFFLLCFYKLVSRVVT